ncbi:MAG: TylF/MycF family methyltransferase [bacterium]|nr:TylF/MycF family methyltransferase [bacterium]
MPTLFSNVKRALIGLGIKPHKLPFIQPPIIDPYQYDDELCAEYDHIASNTVVDRKRVFMLKQFAQTVKNVTGDVAEIGVYRGGTAWLLAHSLRTTGKKIHLFDTFEGMPDVHPDKDKHRKGDFNDTTLEQVKAFLNAYSDVKFYPGFFPATSSPVAETKFCFVHIDVDIFQSVWDCCEFFYPRLAPNGVMVFDDYGFITCPGAKEAVDAFFQDKPETPMYLSTGQAFLFKR